MQTYEVIGTRVYAKDENGDLQALVTIHQIPKHKSPKAIAAILCDYMNTAVSSKIQE